MTTNCQQVQRMVWSAEDLPPYARIHIDGCTECSLEARRAQLLSSSLHGMRPVLADPPAGLVTALVHTADTATSSAWEKALDLARDSSWRKGAAVTAAVGSAAAAAAFGVVLARRALRPSPIG